MNILVLSTSCSSSVGPDLMSEKAAIDMAKEEFGLVQIDLVELSAAGPVYRLVMGQTAEGKKVAAWSAFVVHIERSR